MYFTPSLLTQDTHECHLPFTLGSIYHAALTFKSYAFVPQIKLHVQNDYQWAIHFQKKIALKNEQTLNSIVTRNKDDDSKFWVSPNWINDHEMSCGYWRFRWGGGGSPLTVTPPPPPPENKKLNRVERDSRFDVRKRPLPGLQPGTNKPYFFVLYELHVEHILSSNTLYIHLCISFPPYNEWPMPKP